MRAFVILALVAVAHARPDVGLGYNYNVGQVGLSASGSNLQRSAVLAGSSLRNNGLGQLQPAASNDVSPIVEAGAPQDPLINKHFFIHSAPEDNEVRHKHFILGRPQKNYRVVFIKAPASSNANVRISAEYAPTEEKTHIFVLSQKEAELDVNDIATPAPTQPSKPEVFFVKYRTPEEAQHAQQRIQDQYDQIGGTSEVSDEGTAPVSSVIGALGNDEELAPSSSNQRGVQAVQAPAKYLPPKSSSYLPPRRH